MRLLHPSALCLLIGALAAFSSPSPAQTPDAPLVHFVTDPATDPGFDIEVTELAREGNTSKLNVVHRSGEPRGSLVIVTKAVYQIAKARHAAYFITLQEKMNHDASWALVVGFPDNGTPNVQTDFGKPYEEKNISGKKRVCFSVAECAVLFEKAPASTTPAAPPPLPVDTSSNPAPTATP